MLTWTSVFRITLIGDLVDWSPMQTMLPLTQVFAIRFDSLAMSNAGHWSSQTIRSSYASLNLSIVSLLTSSHRERWSRPRKTLMKPKTTHKCQGYMEWRVHSTARVSDASRAKKMSNPLCALCGRKVSFVSFTHNYWNCSINSMLFFSNTFTNYSERVERSVKRKTTFFSVFFETTGFTQCIYYILDDFARFLMTLCLRLSVICLAGPVKM